MISRPNMACTGSPLWGVDAVMVACRHDGVLNDGCREVRLSEANGLCGGTLTDKTAYRGKCRHC